MIQPNGFSAAGALIAGKHQAQYFSSMLGALERRGRLAHLSDEVFEVLSRSRGELAFPRRTVGLRSTVDFRSRLAALEQAEPGDRPPRVSRPFDAHSRHPSQRKAQRGFFAVEPHLEILFRSVTDAVKRKHRQPLAGKTNGHMDQYIGVEFRTAVADLSRYVD